ncbi:MAG TPA: DUF6691 family protein [Solirubrobacteraceae bacterium]|nr:DUF6691 family protein [Solirubrobacteraceae bacterium]
MSRRLAGLAIGVIFGVVLSWSGMTSPVVIRGALLFQHAYLFLFFASAALTATAGCWLLRRLRARSLIGGEPIGWDPQRPEPRHIIGSLVFGTGWGIADACPGPIATQLGQGAWWGLWTLGGVAIGVWLFLRSRRAEIEPAREPRTWRTSLAVGEPGDAPAP